MLPALSQDMARMVALYGRRVREGMPLAEATAKFAAYDRRNGQGASTGHGTTAGAAMAPKMRMSR